jgi:5-methyltetrahydropteroyltriglutamate--homocysteine methyltransferase
VSTAPRIKTTVVGSYPVPEWLLAAPSEQGLVDATRVVIATQEAAGIDVVCDGELYRFDLNHPETNGMIEYFVRPMQGVRYEMTFDEVVAYRALPGMRFRTRPPGVVDGPIGSGPHMLAKTLLDRHYADTAELAHAIADVLAEQVRHLDADIVQIDEANLPGHPEEWEWAASAMNRVLDAVPTTPAVHLCFGNYGGQSVQSGTWRQLMQYLNALHADHVILECAHRPPEELAVFKDLKPQIGFGLGVVDIKVTEVESADAVAQAIERAEKLLGAGRVRFIHPDCGFWMLKRSVADAKIRALAKGRDLYEGRR